VRRFTADAAHELRTPVTTILGEAEVALRRKRTEEELRAALGTVKDEAQRIAQLLEALLSLARADAGTLLSSRAVLPLSDVVDAAVARARERASRNGHAGIRVESTPTSVLVEGNRPLLSRAFENLLDNAIRHARTQVTVTVATDGTTARIRVVDDGPGISPELVSNLFERFARGDKARSGEGFGLGLSISRAIAQAHGGTLELRPSSSGALFELALPESAGTERAVRDGEPVGATG
jgi:signal transduction histidine kinase